MRRLRGVLLPVLLGALTNGAARQSLGDPSTQYLQRPDGRIYYRVSGNGPTVLILSGGPGYSSGYLVQVQNHLATHTRAVLLDQRGTGRSKLARSDSTTITVEKAIGDVEALRTALHVDRLIIVGHSWGGQLAMAYTAAHPTHVSGLVLVGSGGPTLRSQQLISRQLAARLSAADRDSIARWTTETTSWSRPQASAEIARLNAKAYMYDAAKAAVVEQDRGANAFNSATSRLMFQDLNRVHFDVGRELTETTGHATSDTPVLIIYGEADVIGTATLPDIRAIFPRAEHEVLARSGHYPWIEAPASFYSAVDRFISALR